MSEISELFRDRRIATGLTQTALAQKAGITHRGYRYIEAGERNPSPPVAVALAEALEITRDELFGAMKETAEYCWWPTPPAFALPPVGPAQFPPNLEAFLIQAGVLS